MFHSWIEQALLIPEAQKIHLGTLHSVFYFNKIHTFFRRTSAVAQNISKRRS
jgi:hypothetical protein